MTLLVIFVPILIALFTGFMMLVLTHSRRSAVGLAVIVYLLVAFWTNVLWLLFHHL